MRGLFIPSQILNKADLDSDKKFILSKVFEFEKNGRPFYMSSSSIAKILNRTDRNAQQKVSQLVEQGYLVRKGTTGRKRTLGLSERLKQEIFSSSAGKKELSRGENISEESIKAKISNLNKYYN